MADILVTGAAGFIGFSTSLKLLKDGHRVAGIDNMNDYYDVTLKIKRKNILKRFENFSFSTGDITSNLFVESVFCAYEPRYVIHLAAQAGVGYSEKNPRAYMESNVMGTFNILESAKKTGIKKMFLASSSTVYGDGPETKHEDMPLNPNSLYGITKVQCEQLCNFYNVPTVIGRYFTVYGPYGRPDMSVLKFIEAIDKDKEIILVNNGEMRRSFTYIDNAVEATLTLLLSEADGAYNIGGKRSISILGVVRILEQLMKKKAKITFVDRESWDIPYSRSCSYKLEKTGWEAKTQIEEGLENTFYWYKGKEMN